MTNRWKRVLLSLLTAASLNVSILHIYAKESEEVQDETTEAAVEESGDETIEEVTEEPAEETEEIIEEIPEIIAEEPEEAEEITEEVTENTSEEDDPYGDDYVVDSGSFGNDMYWSFLSTGELWIEGSGKMPDYKWETLSKRPWDSFSDQILSISFGPNLTGVGNYCFSRCTSLKYVYFNDVETVGDYAFSNCTSLENLKAMYDVASIGFSAFTSCDSLKIETLPSSLRSIDQLAFSDCESIEILRIPGSLNSIGKQAFYGCNSLRHLILEEGVSEVGDFAFRWCDSLLTVDLPASITSLGAVCFGNNNRTRTVYYHGTRSSWNKIVEGSGLEKHADIVFPEYGTGIARIYGDDRYATSREIAYNVWGRNGYNSNGAVIVASGKNFADALAGGYLAYKKNAPILLVNGESDSSLKQAASYIEDFCEFTAFVYILGGTDAIPDYFTDYLPDKRVVRLGGNTRYETNLKILEEVGVNKEDILIADSTSFADSLSASAAKRPILLVGKKGLNNDQKNFLNAHKGNMHYILGGTNAISKSIEDAVRSYGTVSRINGSNRYETSLNIAKKFFPDSKSVVLAYGSKFPDGLSGGPLAVKMNAPLLLTKSGYEKYALDYCKSKDIHLGYVLGGDTMITSDIAKTILQIKY